MAPSRVILEFTFRNKKFQRNPEKNFLSPRSAQRAVQQGAGRARSPSTRDLLEKKCEKKKSAKKFGGNQKVRIFAVPFGNGGARTDGRGLRRGDRR